MPRVSVLMPTYKQAHFIQRAIASLQAQSLYDWELIIVDDGSPDKTFMAVEPYLTDERIHYFRLDSNRGLGAALNYAITKAQASFFAYLPSDDVYYSEHLLSLITCLENNPNAILAYSGVRHHYNRSVPGQIPGYPLQPVQVLHRLTADRWMERSELTTDDLERMFWTKLRSQGDFLCTHQVSCEWVDHPAQRHKLLQEPLGGINPYRVYYQVQEPLRVHTTAGNYIDEQEHYRRFRERPDTPQTQNSLKIVLVGELAYNPERVLALEERGHQLYGLWMRDPYWYNTVGPLPFGHVTDIPYENWREALREIQPDIIYALLNWQAVPFAHEVLLANNTGIPFVWHFKEGPFICLEKGTWSQLIELYLRSDAQIYTSPEMHEWFLTVVPMLAHSKHVHILDGDLPKIDWFRAPCSPRLSTFDGEIHTVVPGRPIGLHPETVEELAQQGIHLHFYGDFTQGQWIKWIERAQRLAPHHLHLHKNIDQENWVSEFSQYDAGWLHFIKSHNGGDLRRANWDDLNYPARLATLAMAGLPMLQYDNSNAAVATDRLARNLDIGLFFTKMEELRVLLSNETLMNRLQQNIWARRELFAFDSHADALIDFFRQVIKG